MVFSLAQVRQLSVGALRVTYTTQPVSADDHGVDDALNIDNYALSGPSTNYVVDVLAVDGDPLSFDLTLASSLGLGTWTLSVTNVKEEGTGNPIASPTSLPFLVTHTFTEDSLGHGAKNDEHENIIRKFLNPALKGKGWNSMIAALAEGDQANADNARLAFDQLFLSSAKGLYLDRRANDEGIERPKGVNMSDALFRKLAITQKTRKLTQQAILEVLEVFYGRNSTRAYSDSAAETFALQDNDDLSILVDERQVVTVVFEREHFSRIGTATAEEVAANITRTLSDFGSRAFAIAVTNPNTGERRVRVYSGSLGLTSSIRIVGGRANTKLLFATSLFSQTGSSPFATWDVEFSPETQGNLRFTMTAGTEYNLLLVHEGDLAYIYGDEFTPTGTNGTYTVEKVFVTDAVKWFEIANPLGAELTGIDQVEFTDLMFFRPKRKTIYDNARHVIVCENNDHLDVVIPATTEVVDRGPRLAAYLSGQDAMAGAGFTLTREGDVVTIDVDQSHGLTAGDQIFIDGVLPTGQTADVDAGTPSGNFAGADDNKSGITNASIQTTSSRPGTYEGVFSKAVRNPEGRLVIVGGATTPDGITYTAKNNVTALEVTGESVSLSGGRSVNYRWTQVSNSGTHGFSGNHFAFRSFGSSLLQDGRILCTGGANGDDATGTPSNGWDMLTFLPPDSVSQQFGTLPAARAAHAQASFISGPDALICGGWTVAGTMLATTFRFDTPARTWNAMASMKVARMHHELVALDDGVSFLAIGGMRNAAGTTTVDPPPPPTGLTSFPGTLHFCELYDSSGNTWSMTGAMTYARSHFGVVKIPDGRVIVFGGSGYKPTQIVFNLTTPQTLNTVEIYDPATGIWSVLPPMREARLDPVVTYMPDTNEVWVTSGSSTIPFTEVLDLNKMKWRLCRTAAIVSPHMHATGGRVGDDIFAVVGGDFANVTEKFNDIIVKGKDSLWNGAGINGMHTVATVPDGTHITVDTRAYQYGSNYNVARPGATVTSMAALPVPMSVPGPFSYDVKTGLAITAINSTTDDSFNEGGHYSSIHLEGVDPALDYPDEEGYLVFNFGFKNQVGPIKYLGRLSDEDLILDAAVPFSATVPVGSTVRLLKGRLPYEPARDHLVGSFYVTGTAAGRVAAQKIIDDIIAAGKQVLVSVIYPGDVGLGAQAFPQQSNYKLSDKVGVWGGDALEAEIPLARKGP